MRFWNFPESRDIAKNVQKKFSWFSHFCKQIPSNCQLTVLVYNVWIKQATETLCTSLEAYFCKKWLFLLYYSSMGFLLAIRVKSVRIKFLESAKSSKSTKTWYIAGRFEKLKANVHYANKNQLLTLFSPLQ